jgi:hypothetical protein
MNVARKLGEATGMPMGSGVSQGTMDEGEFTKMIESQTARIPSGTYLTVAVVAMAASAALTMMGRKGVGNFIGQWAPTILIMGLYNKLVKLEGSD